MTLLWTKSKLPVGPIICWGLETNISHFAILFFDSIVFQSNFLGVHVVDFKSFSKYATIVYKKKYDTTIEEESEILISIMKKYLGKKYDWKWFFKLVYYAIIFKIFRKPIPDDIRANSRDKFLCTEAAKLIEKKIGPVDIGNGSPYILARRLGAIR